MVTNFQNHRHSIAGEEKPSPFHRHEKFTIAPVYTGLKILNNFSQGCFFLCSACCLFPHVWLASLAQVQASVKISVSNFEENYNFLFFFMIRAGGTTLEHSRETSKDGNIFPAITVCPFR